MASDSETEKHVTYSVAGHELLKLLLRSYQESVRADAFLGVSQTTSGL